MNIRLLVFFLSIEKETLKWHYCPNRINEIRKGQRENLMQEKGHGQTKKDRTRLLWYFQCCLILSLKNFACKSLRQCEVFALRSNLKLSRMQECMQPHNRFIHTAPDMWRYMWSERKTIFCQMRNYAMHTHQHLRYYVLE